MYSRLIVCTAAVIASPVLGQADGFAGPYAAERWADTGIDEGTVTIGNTVELGYDVDAPSSLGVSFRTAEYSATAPASGALRLHYDARYFHAFFAQDYFLQAFADGPNGRETLDLVDVMNAGAGQPREFNGDIELDVTEGFGYGFVFGGGNFDSTTVLEGRMVLLERFNTEVPIETEAANWTVGTIQDGVASARPATVVEYEVQSPIGGGVPFRDTIASVFATEDGEATFNWTYAGFHAFHMTSAQLAFIDAQPVETVVVDEGDPGSSFAFTGRQTLSLESSSEFGLRVGGSNFDSSGFITGKVAIWDTHTSTDEPCLADQNQNGVVEPTDFGAWLANYNAGCD